MRVIAMEGGWYTTTTTTGTTTENYRIESMREGSSTESIPGRYWWHWVGIEHMTVRIDVERHEKQYKYTNTTKNNKNNDCKGTKWTEKSVGYYYQTTTRVRYNNHYNHHEYYLLKLPPPRRQTDKQTDGQTDRCGHGHGRRHHYQYVCWMMTSCCLLNDGDVQNRPLLFLTKGGDTIRWWRWWWLLWTLLLLLLWGEFKKTRRIYGVKGIMRRIDKSGMENTLLVDVVGMTAAP